MYKWDNKIAVGKTMPGNLLTMGSIIAHSLAQDWSSPTKWMGLSSFETLFGHLPPWVKGLWGDLQEIRYLTLRQQMQALGLTLSKINGWVRERLHISLTTPMHPYKPGDAVWVKEWNVQLLKPHWRGPFVVLSTPTAVKVAEIVPWIHHSWVKPVSLE
jgi:hypothetical protein